MNFRTWAEDYCTSRGMFETQAKAVVEAVAADLASGIPADLWDKDIDGYPKAVLVVVSLCIQRQAVAYIEANCPTAWFKPMFGGTIDP